MTLRAPASRGLGRRRLLAGFSALSGAALLEWLNLRGNFDHRSLEVRADRVIPARDIGRDSLVHIGHSTHLLELGGARVLTDPWFYDPAHGGMWHARGPALAPDALGALGLILITHEHPDHADEVALDRLDKRALVVAATPALARRARALGFSQVETLAPWQGLVHAGVRIDAVPALHDVYEVGYVIERGAQRVLFAGDSALHRDLPAIAERFAPTLAILPVDGTRVRGSRRLVMTPDEAVHAARVLGASMVIPSHADSRFFDPVLSFYATQVDAAAARFLTAMRSALPGVRCVVPAVGERVALI